MEKDDDQPKRVTLEELRADVRERQARGETVEDMVRDVRRSIQQAWLAPLRKISEQMTATSAQLKPPALDELETFSEQQAAWNEEYVRSLEELWEQRAEDLAEEARKEAEREQREIENHAAAQRSRTYAGWALVVAVLALAAAVVVPFLVG